MSRANLAVFERSDLRST